MDQFLDVTTVIGLLFAAFLGIAGIVRFLAMTKKKQRTRPFQDSIQDY